MRLGLVSLPLWSIDWPPLSLASLAGYLRNHGYHDFIQKDLNIKFFHKILSRDYLLALRHRIDTQMSFLSSNDDKNKYLVYNKLAVAQKKLDFLAAKIDDIVISLRKPADSDAIEVKNYHLLHEVLEIISLSYAPLSITLNNVLFKRVPIKSKEVFEFHLEHEWNNPFFEFAKEEIRTLVEDDRVDVLGLSVSTMDQMLASITIAKLSKKYNPEMKIVLGGSLVYYVVKFLTDWEYLNSLIDFIVIGEGETPLKLLLDHFSGSSFPIERVPNLVYKQNNTFVYSENTQHIEDVNQLPTPDFDGFDLDLYLAPQVELPILSSRGCYWDKCSFCNICATYMNKYRVRDIGLFIEDIATLQRKYDNKYLTIADECISPARLRKISEGILQRKIEIYWDILARFEKGFLKDHDIFDTVYDAGCRMITFGLESASEKVLASMSKGINLGIAKKILRATAESSIWNNVFFFFGFPGETDGDRKETIDFIISNSEFIHSHSATVFRLEEGSKIFQDPGQFDINIIPLEKEYIGTEQDFSYRDGTKWDLLLDAVLDLPKILNDQLSFSPKLMQGMTARNLKQYLSKHKLDHLSRVYNRHKKEYISLFVNNGSSQVNLDKMITAMKENSVERRSVVLLESDGKERDYFVCFCRDTSRFFIMSQLGSSIFDRIENIDSFSTLCDELCQEYELSGQHLRAVERFLTALFTDRCLSHTCTAGYTSANLSGSAPLYTCEERS